MSSADELISTLFWVVLIFNVTLFLPTSSIVNNPYPSKTIKCPLTKESSCAIDVSPVEIIDSVSLGQCYSACNKLPECNWFNFMTSSGGASGLGECRLIVEEPKNVTLVPGCAYFQVSLLQLNQRLVQL